jgi:NADPH:quinone reductase-like Zn-dependent oxidoreductase
MRALAIRSRGAAPEVEEVPNPGAGGGEVRIAVEAASINGFDLAVAGGYVWEMMPHTFPVVLGRDYAGVVEAVGAGVEGVRVGDRVAGVITARELGAGPIGELLVVDESAITAVPDSVTTVQAAAVGLAGITAVDAVAELGIASGDVVLISGATGGVGAFAVQLAAARGAKVVATAVPGAATDFVRALEAAEVVDYSDDVAAEIRAISPDGVAKVLHAAGDLTALGSVLAAGGRLVSTVGARAEQVDRDDVSVIAAMASYAPPKLDQLLEQVVSGRLSVPVTAEYPLAEAAQALTAFAGGKLGKIVVTP